MQGDLAIGRDADPELDRGRVKLGVIGGGAQDLLLAPARDVVDNTDLDRLVLVIVEGDALALFEAARGRQAEARLDALIDDVGGIADEKGRPIPMTPLTSGAFPDQNALL